MSDETRENFENWCAIRRAWNAADEAVRARDLDALSNARIELTVQIQRRTTLPPLPVSDWPAGSILARTPEGYVLACANSIETCWIAGVWNGEKIVTEGEVTMLVDGPAKAHDYLVLSWTTPGRATVFPCGTTTGGHVLKPVSPVKNAIDERTVRAWVTVSE